MLRAEQVALEQAAYQQLLQIREKELNYYVNNYTSIGTQAALLSGFIISALVELSHVPHGWFTVIFHVSVSVGLMAGVHCVLATTFATVWGPGLALRGSKGSMVRAVNGMVEEQQAIFASFGVCMVAFTAMGITTSWLVMQMEAAIIATVVSAGNLQEMDWWASILLTLPYASHRCSWSGSSYATSTASASSGGLKSPRTRNRPTGITARTPQPPQATPFLSRTARPTTTMCKPRTTLNLCRASRVAGSCSGETSTWSWTTTPPMSATPRQ
jgi:hypothetical protein